MALVRSFVVPDKDESRKNMDYYVNNIKTVKEMLRLMKTRLHLVKANAAPHKFSLPHNDTTRLERDLMEVLRGLLKLCMNRQLLNIALQKSIQSSLLHSVSRNLFTAKRLNYIEDTVAQQMKLMIEKNEKMCLLREEVNKQDEEIARMEEELLGPRVRQHERLSSSIGSITSEKSRAKLKDVTKLINNINKLSQLLTIMVTQSAEQGSSTPEEENIMMQLAVKWRTPKSLSYYSS